jgi:hypothetical protein
MERIFASKRYLTLLVNEIALADAILTVMEEKLWLSKDVDPFYSVRVIQKVRLDNKGRGGNKPTISLSLGDNLVEVAYTISSLHISFPVSKFVEEVLNHLEENPVIYLCDNPERQRIFREKWQEMLELLGCVSPDTAGGL